MLIKIIFIIGIILGVYLEQKFNLPKIQKFINLIKNKIMPSNNKDKANKKNDDKKPSNKKEDSNQKPKDEKYLTIAYVSENAIKNMNDNSFNNQIIRKKHQNKNLVLLKEPNDKSAKIRNLEDYDMNIIRGNKINNYYQVIYNKNTTKLINYDKNLQIVKDLKD